MGGRPDGRAAIQDALSQHHLMLVLKLDDSRIVSKNNITKMMTENEKVCRAKKQLMLKVNNESQIRQKVNHQGMTQRLLCSNINYIHYA